MIAVSGITLGEVFANLAADDRLDDSERSAVGRIAGWLADYERHDAARVQATQDGDRAAWEAHSRERDRLMEARPFAGNPKSTAASFHLISGDVKFTVRPYTTGATMNVGVDRVAR
jgi:hypothetical protein